MTIAAGVDVLPYGLTVVGLEAVARRAAWWSRWSFPRFAERYDVARFAIVEHLYTCREHTPDCDLARVGVRAIDRHVAGNATFYGLVLQRPGATVGTPMPRYWRYWASTPGPTRSPEEQVVEVMALCQIWPRLRQVDQAAIVALATHGDYAAAAQALGMTHRSFRDRIYRARRSFLRLWHEHEVPSGMWSRDYQLTNPRGYRTNSIGSTLLQRRRLHHRRQTAAASTVDRRRDEGVPEV